MPVTVWAWGWAQNPTVRAQKTSKVGAVKQPRKRSSRLETERGRLRVSIGGDLWFGDRVREPPMLACALAGKQLSRSRHRYQPKTAKLQLVIVGDEGPGGWLPGVVVVPDRSGQGEDALQHPHDDACRGVPAVAFQVELALEGLVDRLDDLPQRLEQVRAGPFGLALARRA